ncbi:hypothetical protein H4R19_005898, partial [Coemansia spiralis]
FAMYPAGPAGLSPERKTLGSAPPAHAESGAVQGLDALYERLNGVSLSLKGPRHMPLSAPATHSGTPHAGSPESPRSAPTAGSGASSPSAATAAGGAVEQSHRECDPDCACRRVLLDASPGACGVCGGRPGVLARLNAERLQAQDDLDIASQRINELAHEKARHVDYIADLEARTAEQARRVDQQRDVIAGLKSDLAAMNDKFVDQVNMTAEIAHSRELVEAELEDLTQKLFTEANTMVAAEKKARVDAERSAAHLRNIIADLEMRLSSETMQSQELKGHIEKMSAEYDGLLKSALVPSRRGSVGSHASDAAAGDGVSSLGGGSGGAAGTHGDTFRLATHAAAVMAGTKGRPVSPTTGAPIRLDDQLLTEFREFAVQTQTQRHINHLNTSYMKSVVTADVEPCLRFGPSPRISSRNVLDSIASNRIQIEEMTPQIAAEMRRQQQTADRSNAPRHAMLWERLSGSVAFNPNGCQACGRECQQCTYRFRTGNKQDSEWIQIDTICRDRLVAVCEFYGFVRYMRQGIFASRAITDLYIETIRLRLSMFYARIGAYGYVMDLDPNIAEAPPFLRNSHSTAHPPASPT